MFVISSVNVNGLRAAGRKGFLGWLAGTDAEVVCLQETRAAPEQLPAGLRELDGWHAVHAPGTVKGRNGVAVLSRAEPSRVCTGFGVPEFDDAGRYLEVDLDGLTVASLYLPKGEVGTERQASKERFMAALLPYLARRREQAAAQGREMLVCGDFNIAHTEVDLKNARGNRNSSGFLPGERVWLDEMFGPAGYRDVVRRLYPNSQGPYSWWSYRGRAFDNDAGWRIDLVCAPESTARRARWATVERASSYDKRWSDHAPVTVAFDR